jgi:hypothetical protein
MTSPGRSLSRLVPSIPLARPGRTSGGRTRRRARGRRDPGSRVSRGRSRTERSEPDSRRPPDATDAREDSIGPSPRAFEPLSLLGLGRCLAVGLDGFDAVAQADASNEVVHAAEQPAPKLYMRNVEATNGVAIHARLDAEERIAGSIRDEDGRERAARRRARPKRARHGEPPSLRGAGGGGPSSLSTRTAARRGERRRRTERGRDRAGAALRRWSSRSRRTARTAHVRISFAVGNGVTLTRSSLAFCLASSASITAMTVGDSRHARAAAMVSTRWSRFGRRWARAAATFSACAASPFSLSSS